MKKTSFILSILIIGFFLFPFSSLNAQVVELQWNTFLGSTDYDYGYGITLDSSGNVYLTGYSAATWGFPKNSHSGGNDAFVVCLNTSGNVVWNTFLGSAGNEYGYSIALDSSGNVYITGIGNATWGSPVNAYSGNDDVFVACLDSSGSLLWNTFLGSVDYDYGFSIALDSSGNVYVSGQSFATWGLPVNAHSGSSDVVVFSLNNSGTLLWNTFLGSSTSELGRAIVLDSFGDIYVAGYGGATWGFPKNSHSGGNDAFVVCLNTSGNVVWNTFLGSSSEDCGLSLITGNSGNVYVTGFSDATWGSPINAYSNGYDAFIACLNNNGYLTWNTFLGSAGNDTAFGIALDSSDNIYVTGHSNATWGSPVNAFSGGEDAFSICLDSSGNLIWNTFFGSADSDYGNGIALGSSGNIYVTGYSNATWGSPLNAHSGDYDVFVAKLSTYPLPGILANGSDGSIKITPSDTLRIRVSLNTFGSTANVDYWLAYKGPSGWVHYNNTTKKWETGLGVTHQGPLMDLNNKKVYQSSGLALGVYTFYFGVDMVMDGKVTKSSLYKDEVQVVVIQ